MRKHAKICIFVPRFNRILTRIWTTSAPPLLPVKWTPGKLNRSDDLCMLSVEIEIGSLIAWSPGWGPAGVVVTSVRSPLPSIWWVYIWSKHAVKIKMMVLQITYDYVINLERFPEKGWNLWEKSQLFSRRYGKNGLYPFLNLWLNTIFLEHISPLLFHCCHILWIRGKVVW